MKRKGWLIIFLFQILISSSCKISEPKGIQVAPPLEVGFVKGPAVFSSGKFFFMEKEAEYRPHKIYFINLQIVQTFPYTEIDTVEKAKLLGLLPVIEILKMKNGKKYKLRINHKYKLAETLNGLKE